MPAFRLVRVRESPLIRAFVFFAAALVLTLVVHGFSLWFGFDYDDYHLLRPYTLHEVGATFSGPWDPSGVEVAFYRPLTTTFYAARFWLLGLDAWKYHALSLLMFSGAATLFALFVALVARSWLAGLVTVAVYVLHPAMPRSQVVWATNQMHLMSSLVVGGTLVWWAAQGRWGRGWGWAGAAAAVALLVKEDGVMLLPLLAALQPIAGTFGERLGSGQRTPRFPPVGWLVLGGGLIAALLVARHVALGGLGGYGAHPSLEQAWRNYEAGIRIGFFGVRTDRWYLWPWAETFVKAALAGGIVASLVRRQWPLAFVITTGIVGAALFDVPFVLVTKAEQYHLIASFSAIAIASALVAAWRSFPRRSWSLVAGAAIVAGLFALGAAARHRGQLFTPYTPWTLGHDAIVADWASVPLEIREWLREGVRTRRRPATARISNLPVVVWGASDYEDDGQGRRVRWLAPRTTILPSAGVRWLDLPLVVPGGAGGGTSRVAVESADGRVAELSLRPGDATTVRVPVRARIGGLPLARRVTITVASDRTDTSGANGQPRVGMGEIRWFARREQVSTR
jgi:hypothetical protein